MKHIIIEGPDGAGKTALAAVLCRALGMAYHHEGPPPPGVDLRDHYLNTLRSNTRVPTVFDRFHLGEVVYGPLLREKSGLTPRDVQIINQAFKDLGGSIIICLPPWETCIENSRAKAELELIQDEVVLQAAYDAWTVLAKTRALFRGQLYDYTELYQQQEVEPDVVTA